MEVAFGHLLIQLGCLPHEQVGPWKIESTCTNAGWARGLLNSEKKILVGLKMLITWIQNSVFLHPMFHGI